MTATSVLFRAGALRENPLDHRGNAYDQPFDAIHINRAEKPDRLDDLAETANQALAKVEQAFGELHRQNSAIQAAVA